MSPSQPTYSSNGSAPTSTSTQSSRFEHGISSQSRRDARQFTAGSTKSSLSTPETILRKRFHLGDYRRNGTTFSRPSVLSKEQSFSANYSDQEFPPHPFLRPGALTEDGKQSEGGEYSGATNNDEDRVGTEVASDAEWTERKEGDSEYNRP